MFMFSQLLYHELRAQSSKPTTSLSLSTSPPPPYRVVNDIDPAESSSGFQQSPSNASTSCSSLCKFTSPPAVPLRSKNPSSPEIRHNLDLLRDQSLVQDSEPNHPFVVQSTSSKLAHGFPRISLPLYLPSGHVAYDSWSHFIDCVNAKVKTSVSTNATTDGLENVGAGDMEAYITQWSAEFFEPRGLQIILRRSGDPVLDANTGCSCPHSRSLSPSSPQSPSLSLSLSQSHTTLPILSEPPDGWMSKKSAAARASGKKVDEKLERERQKHEAHVQATERKAQKAAEKLENSARKQVAKARRWEGMNAKNSGRDLGSSRRAAAVRPVGEVDERCWELVVQSL